MKGYEEMMDYEEMKEYAEQFIDRDYKKKKDIKVPRNNWNFKFSNEAGFKAGLDYALRCRVFTDKDVMRTLAYFFAGEWKTECDKARGKMSFSVDDLLDGRDIGNFILGFYYGALEVKRGRWQDLSYYLKRFFEYLKCIVNNIREIKNKSGSEKSFNELKERYPDYFSD